jgi:hypothetical protein
MYVKIKSERLRNWWMENVLKVFRKISLAIQSQMLTDIQYIVEEIPIMTDSHLLKISTT